jgi:hypothetical protein
MRIDKKKPSSGMGGDNRSGILAESQPNTIVI